MTFSVCNVFLFLFFILFLKRFYVCMYVFREHKGGQGKRERENLKQTQHWVQSPNGGWISRPEAHDLSRNQEPVTQPTELPKCPCLPLFKVQHTDRIISPASNLILLQLKICANSSVGTIRRKMSMAGNSPSSKLTQREYIKLQGSLVNMTTC